MGAPMSATLIFGVDFRNKTPKAERIFTLGPEGEVYSKVVEIENVALVDTAPCEYAAPENDPA